MKIMTKFASLLAFALVASISYAQSPAKADPPRHGPPVLLAATIIGHFDYLAEGGPAWAGHAIVQFGDKPVQVATFTDRGGGPPTVREDGSFYGTETITLNFADGTGSFDIVCNWEAVPASTPGLYILHESGTIANGTLNYSRVSGSITAHGPFLHPDPALNPTALDVPPPWIEEMVGKIFGLGN